MLLCVAVRKQTAQCTLSNAEAVACGVCVHVYVVNADVCVYVCVCVCMCVCVHVCMFVYVVCVVHVVSKLCARSRSLSKMTTHTRVVRACPFCIYIQMFVYIYMYVFVQI